MGSRSQKGRTTQRLCRFKIPLILSLCEPPELVAAQAQAKILKTVGAWCASYDVFQVQKRRKEALLLLLSLLADVF